jgi:hypothetical protein
VRGSDKDTVVFAAMALSHYIETQTGWSIKKFVRAATAPCCRLVPAAKS